MKAINWKWVSYILLGLVFIVCFINWFIRGQVFNFMFVINSISLSVATVSVIATVFCTKLWKNKFFSKWLVLIPNMNGVWEGTIQSNWIDSLTPIDTKLTIKQSLFSISCVMKTTEMRSSSINAGFNINPNSQEFQLIYTYISTPQQHIQERSQMHYGTIIFDFDTNYDVSDISGNYWTGRGTAGFITMKKKE